MLKPCRPLRGKDGSVCDGGDSCVDGNADGSDDGGFGRFTAVTVREKPLDKFSSARPGKHHAKVTICHRVSYEVSN